MANNQVVVDYIVDDKSSQTLNQIEKAHKSLAQQIGSTRDLTQGFGAGMLIAEASLSSFGDTAGKASSGIDLAKTAMQSFGLAILNPTPLGLAAVAVGVLVGAADALEKQFQKTLQPSKDLQKSLTDLGGAQTAIGKQIEQTLGIKGADADVMGKAAAASTSYAAALRDAAKARQALLEVEKPMPAIGFENLAKNWIPGVADAQERERIRLNDAVRLQGMGLKMLDAQLAVDADRMNEQNRVLAISTAAIPKVNAAWKDYQATLTGLQSTHAKNIAALNEQAQEEGSDASGSTSKVFAEQARRILRLQTDLYKQLGELDHNYAIQVEQQMRQRQMVVRDDNRQIIQWQEERFKSIRDIDERLGDQLTTIHTDREREKAQLAAMIDRRNVEQTYAEHLRDLAQKKADRSEEFAFQKSLMDSQLAHQKEIARENNATQIQSAREAAAIQAQAIQDGLAKQLAAIEKRKTEEDTAYADSTGKAKLAYQDLAKSLTDLRTEQEKFNGALMDMLGSKYPALITQANEWLRLTTGTARGMQDIFNATGVNPHMQSGQWQPMARGGDFIASGPTPLIVGEAGAERVTITPLGSGGRGNVTFNITGNNPQEIAREVARILAIEGLR